MKLILFLLVTACVANRLTAEEPKASPLRSADEISKEIEALQMKIKALDEEKKSLQRKSSGDKAPVNVESASSDRKISGNIKTAVVRGRKLVMTTRPAVIVTIPKDIELGAAEYMSPKMSMEMAERHSAEKIKAQVKEADANAKRILEGRPPSLVHGN
jgi:hypothetical protein